MTKYILIIAALIFFLSDAIARTTQRAPNNPGFFIPRQTLKQMYNQQEKLPPVQISKPQNRSSSSAPNNQNQTQKNSSETKQPLAQNTNLPTAANTPQKPNHKNRPAAVEQPQKIKNQQTAAKENPNLKPSPKKPVIAAPTPHKIPVDTKPAEDSSPTKKATATSSPLSPNLPLKNPKKEITYDEIIKEYQRDILNISKNIPFKNDRLKNMIHDYRNLERKI